MKLVEGTLRGKKVMVPLREQAVVLVHDHIPWKEIFGSEYKESQDKSNDVQYGIDHEFLVGDISEGSTVTFNFNVDYKWRLDSRVETWLQGRTATVLRANQFALLFEKIIPVLDKLNLI